MFYLLSLSQVFEKVNTTPGSSQRKTSNQKFKSLIKEQEASPEIQEKLKIAFAEGYTAHDRKEGDGTGTSTWVRRAVKFAWYGLLVWLAFQLLQGYSAFGGSEWNGITLV